MAQLRTLAEWEALTGEEELTAPERYLIECCREGNECVLDAACPEGPDPDRSIRAALLAYLMLGGCEKCPVRPWNVHIEGAFFFGELDLSYERIIGSPTFRNCTFNGPIVALNSQFTRIGIVECIL